MATAHDPTFGNGFQSKLQAAVLCPLTENQQINDVGVGKEWFINPQILFF